MVTKENTLSLQLQANVVPGTNIIDDTNFDIPGEEEAGLSLIAGALIGLILTALTICGIKINQKLDKRREAKKAKLLCESFEESFETRVNLNSSTGDELVAEIGSEL